MEAELAVDLGPKTHLDALLAAVGPVEGLTVVDVGCGLGELARGLAERGARVFGVDPLIDGTDETPHGRGSFRLLRASGEAMPLPDQAADLVVFVFSLHHVPMPVLPAALSEARRVLRDGGRLYVAEPLAEGPNFEITAEFHDETEVRAAAAKALDLHAAPAFASVRELSYTDRRSYPTFEAFATRMIANTRFNGYRAEDVTRPRVRERFAALARRHGGQFDQPVRVCLYG